MFFGISKSLKFLDRGDFVQLIDSLWLKLQCRRLEVFVEVLDVRRAGDNKNIRRPLQQPCESNLSRRRTKGSRCCI